MPRSPRNTLPRVRQSQRARVTRSATESAADARFAEALQELPYKGEPAAIALSGGGDSMALLHLMRAHAQPGKAAFPDVLIVDHGLRKEAAQEAKRVAVWAKEAGFAAHVLCSAAPAPKANIEEEARQRRYALMGEWCLQHGRAVLFVAHTLDDQAETFLLRLGRGSGVDGLSGMRARAPFPLPEFSGLTVMRPLLLFRREELRAYLNARCVPFVEDPMNKDPRFARTRIRAVLATLAEAGVSPERIASAAAHLARARAALESATGDFLAAHARFPKGGMALLDRSALKTVPREIGLRALRQVLMRVAGTGMGPRFEKLEPLFDSLASGDFRARTLLSCRIGKAVRAHAVFGGATIAITREAPRQTAQKGSRAP